MQHFHEGFAEKKEIFERTINVFTKFFQERKNIQEFNGFTKCFADKKLLLHTCIINE